MSNYLQDLTLRLAVGASRLDESTRDVHARFVETAQRADGGWAGREGESDPYYTAFALRTLSVLGRLSPSVAQRAAAFLRQRLSRRDSIVDLMSLIFAAAILELFAGEVVIPDDDEHWRANVAGLLATMRTPDGGFAKTPEGHAGSTYQTFLAILCHELMDAPVPDPDAVAAFLQSQSLDDGGYREIRVAKRAGVNPTAAAIGSLKAIGRLEPDAHEPTISFLAEMQTPEGGLTANTRIPFPDLLSTCTGLITLADLQSDDVLHGPALIRYARAMQRRDDRGELTGGFVGFELDQETDVEYTFYGVATLCLAVTLYPDPEAV